MSLVRGIRKAIKNIAFGDVLVPQEFTLGLPEPQTEISVWLHGAGQPVDVTQRRSMMCSAPLTFCIGFDEGQEPPAKGLDRLSLKYSERDGQKRVLGEIRLKYQTRIPLPGLNLLTFVPRDSRNYCLPMLPLWSHYLLYEYNIRITDNPQAARMSFLERRTLPVNFICPHPTLLVSVGNADDGNIFPMNILGDLGNGYIGFALRNDRLAGKLIQRAGRAALSSLPLSQGSLAYRLAFNHTQQSIDWNQLPFATKNSAAFRIPVPEFALRVREVELQTVRPVGCHSFYIARIINDEKFSDGLGFCSIHGFYQSWRLRGSKDQLELSVLEDAHNKRDRYVTKPVPSPLFKSLHRFARFSNQGKAAFQRLWR